MLKKSFYTSVIAGDISTIAGLGGGVNLVIWLLQLGESVFGDRHQFMQLQAADALADFFCNLCTNKRICFINHFSPHFSTLRNVIRSILDPPDDDSTPPEQRKTHERTWFLDSGRVWKIDKA